MKTAMQEFLDWVQIYCDNQPYLIPEEAKKKATELLEKEKEQIVNAYTIGNRNGLNNKALGANKYYRETYITP